MRVIPGGAPMGSDASARGGVVLIDHERDLTLRWIP
jgi:hypothetical protein